MGLCVSKPAVIESNNVAVERNRIAELPKDIFIQIMSLSSPATLAAVRDVSGGSPGPGVLLFALALQLRGWSRSHGCLRLLDSDPGTGTDEEPNYIVIPRCIMRIIVDFCRGVPESRQAELSLYLSSVGKTCFAHHENRRRINANRAMRVQELEERANACEAKIALNIRYNILISAREVTFVVDPSIETTSSLHDRMRILNGEVYRDGAYLFYEEDRRLENTTCSLDSYGISDGSVLTYKRRFTCKFPTDRTMYGQNPNANHHAAQLIEEDWAGFVRLCRRNTEVQKLVDMGFGKDIAIQTLQACDGNVETAIAMLLS